MIFPKTSICHGFSIAMLNNQMVYCKATHLLLGSRLSCRKPVDFLLWWKSTKIHKHPQKSMRIVENPPKSTKIHENPPILRHLVGSLGSASPSADLQPFGWTAGLVVPLGTCPGRDGPVLCSMGIHGVNPNLNSSGAVVVLVQRGTGSNPRLSAFECRILWRCQNKPVLLVNHH